MTLRILYFATMRDLAGVREETVSLPEGSRVEDLKDLLGKKHPQLIKAFNSAIFAVNREFALDDQPLKEGDEVAVFPPVSGGSVNGPTILRIVREPLDVNALLKEIITPAAGAACVLTEGVQAQSECDELLEITHQSSEPQRSMVEAQMEQVVQEIHDRWTSVEGVAIVQRSGEIQPDAPTVMVACTAVHRDAGVFEAARYGLERMVHTIPLIEKEIDPE
ncbi:MAG: molybdopterin converting factor subunit 1 [Anaerolineales bacterium]|nr:molybdopterin converting factor subunit 1 [Anaerolineales bacterium]